MRMFCLDCLFLFLLLTAPIFWWEHIQRYKDQGKPNIHHTLTTSNQQSRNTLAITQICFNNKAPDGSVTRALEGLKTFSLEMAENVDIND